MSNFDPTDLLDFLDTKKKLPGERKPVFPEGVPGLEQGVPKELYKGSAQEQLDQQNAAGRGRRRAPPPKSRNRSSAKTKQQRQPAAAPRLPDAACRAEDGGATAAAPPPPKPKKIVRKRTTAPPPDQQAAQPAPAGATRATAATIGCAIPGADAEQQLPALISVSSRRHARRFDDLRYFTADTCLSA